MTWCGKKKRFGVVVCLYIQSNSHHKLLQVLEEVDVELHKAVAELGARVVMPMRESEMLEAVFSGYKGLLQKV